MEVKAWLQTKRFCNDQLRNLAQWRLERKLTKCIELSEAHFANGIKPGDERYQMLWKVADHAIHQFCVDWSVDREMILAQVPGIRILERYSHPDPADDPKAKAIVWAVSGLILGSVLSLILAVYGGIVLGISTRIYHLIVR